MPRMSDGASGTRGLAIGTIVLWIVRVALAAIGLGKWHFVDEVRSLSA